MPQSDDIWRTLVNNIAGPEAGADPPDMEKIPKKKRSTRKFNVQKIVTEIFVYTDLKGQQFNEITFQDLVLLGDMSEAQLNKILSIESHKRHGRDDG